MLQLTRNPSQKIIINDDIEVIVVAVKGKQVRLGIKAPKEVKILREEMYLKQTEGNKNESTGN